MNRTLSLSAVALLSACANVATDSDVISEDGIPMAQGLLDGVATVDDVVLFGDFEPVFYSEEGGNAADIMTGRYEMTVDKVIFDNSGREESIPETRMVSIQDREGQPFLFRRAPLWEQGGELSAYVELTRPAGEDLAADCIEVRVLDARGSRINAESMSLDILEARYFEGVDCPMALLDINQGIGYHAILEYSPIVLDVGVDTNLASKL